jgi:hypothetical protein
MKTTWAKVLIFSIPLFIAGIGYALTQVSFNNTSIIVSGQNIFITQPTFSVQTCPLSGDASYKAGGFTQLSWILTQGGAAVQAFFCIDNQGSSTDSPSVTHSTNGISDGACPSTGNTLTWVPPTGIPATLTPHMATSAPVVIGICAGGGVAASTSGPSFTVTVT